MLNLILKLPKVYFPWCWSDNKYGSKLLKMFLPKAKELSLTLPWRAEGHEGDGEEVGQHNLRSRPHWGRNTAAGPGPAGGGARSTIRASGLWAASNTKLEFHRRLLGGGGGAVEVGARPPSNVEEPFEPSGSLGVLFLQYGTKIILENQRKV